MDFNKLFNSDILQSIFFGNTIQDYLIWILVVTIGFLFKKNFSQYITKIVFGFIRRSTNINVNGFLYIVTGEGYAKECLFSIKSLKVYNNEKICVFSEEKYRSMFENECDYFFSINSKIKRQQ